MKINDVLNERTSNYGSFEDNSTLTAFIYEIFEQDIRHEKAFVKEAIHMICHKVARIINGKLEYEDSWVDIVGYCQCVIDILQKNPQQDISDVEQVFLNPIFCTPDRRPPRPVYFGNHTNYTPFKGFLVQDVVHYLLLGVYSDNLCYTGTWERIRNAASSSLEYLRNYTGEKSYDN